MKGTLIRKAECWYNLYQEKIGFGSTHWELQGHKLCQKNCDEIFEVVDVEKLAHEFSQNLRGRSNLYAIIGFDAGFNKAMELNKDKQFTLEDLRTAMTYGIVQEGTGFEGIHSVDDLFNLILKKVSQPTEIEVEIEMEPMNLDEIREQGKGFLHGNTKKPKLDENGCLILKKSAPARAL
jgi:hypothetical protein